MIDYPSLATGMFLGASIVYMCVSRTIAVERRRRRRKRD